MDFEVDYKKYLPLKLLLYYTTIIKYYFSILRYFGWREDIFWHFSTILAGYRGNGVPFLIFYDIFKTVNIYTLHLDTSHWFESPFKNWDILAGVKTSFARFRGFWLVAMETGYHLEFFMTFLKFLIYVLFIWAQVINLGVLSKSLVYSPLNNDPASCNLNKKCFIYFHNRNYWQGKHQTSVSNSNRNSLSDIWIMLQ